MDTRSLPLNPHNVKVLLRPDGRVFIEVYSQPHDGPAWILDGFPAVLQSTQDAKTLGKAILEGLEKSTYDLRSADELWNRPTMEEFLKWAGARNWKAYTKGSKAVGVYSRYSIAPPATIDITPEKRESNGGFSPIVEVCRDDVAFAGAEDLGRLVQEALKVTRT